MSRRTRCPYCRVDLVGREALDVACEIPFEAWRSPFDPGRSTKVILVGLAPPEWTGGPKTLDRVKYIYRSPRDPMPDGGTVRLLWEALRNAIMDTPLEKTYCRLSEYYRSESQTYRGEFLEALKGDGIVWEDCIMHPIPTGEVYRMTKDEDFLDELSERLSVKPFSKVLFLSSSQSHRTLSQSIDRKLRESVREEKKAMYVFASSFWPVPDGFSRENALNRRSLELRKGLSADLLN